MSIGQGIIWGVIAGLMMVLFLFAGMVTGAMIHVLTKNNCVPSITELCS
jgi:hypothetical protein